MASKSKIAAGVAGGYLLGRTKRLRLAMTLASMLAGQKVAGNRQELLAQGNKLLNSSPQLQQLQEQLSGRLMQVAREAAMMAVATRVESMTRSLQGSEDEQDEDEQDGEEPTDEA